MDYSNLPRHNVICVDMKSFYASCEAVARGVDPFKAKLVVVGDANRKGSVVLASSPKMKSMYGIKTGSRLFEVEKIPDKEIIVVQARMSYYLDMSKKVRDIFEMFVPPNSIHTYSVDESWLTLDGTEKLWGNALEASKKIIRKVYDETGLIATVGIGDNKFLAKFVLDVYGKKNIIAECRYENVVEMFHHIPVHEMWGIGSQITKRMGDLGIYTVGDLAHANLELLKKEFGKIGLQFHNYAWGIDNSPVFYDENNPPAKAFGFMQDDSVPNHNIKSIGRGVTLLEDYVKKEDILLVIRDLTEEVCEILRRRKMEGKTINLSIDYSRAASKKGFSRQKTIKGEPTNDIQDVLQLAYQIFTNFHEEGQPVRKIRMSISKLSEEQVKFIIDEEKRKRKKVIDVMDELNDKFGKGTLRSGSSFKRKKCRRFEKG